MPAPPPACVDGVTLQAADCRTALPRLDAGSIHMALTDPPYFLDGLDGDWRRGDVRRKPPSGVIKGLPIGMAFKPDQGARLQRFMAPVMEQLHRVLKPGAFALAFSAPRLSHHMAMAAEAAGFEIRDMLVWRFRGRSQFKAHSQSHWVRRRSDWSDAEKAEALRRLDGRRTPQLRPQHEAVVCAQKPREGTFVNNWLRHETGLIDASQRLDGAVPSTVMEVEKPNREAGNQHLTPKPLRLCRHLIQVFSAPGQTILDPFVGSGTVCLAAHLAGRRSIGFDIRPEYVRLAQERIASAGAP